ncbi:hypothetical protein [Pantoea sp. JK]|jgi:hypothetical protein
MDFDANTHRCTLVIDRQLPARLAMNASSGIGINFGKIVPLIDSPLEEY